jgi:hypothetical protein
MVKSGTSIADHQWERMMTAAAVSFSLSPPLSACLGNQWQTIFLLFSQWLSAMFCTLNMNLVHSHKPRMVQNGGTVTAERSLHTLSTWILERASIAAVCECRFLLFCLVIAATSSATTGPERKNLHSNCFQRRPPTTKNSFLQGNAFETFFLWTFCGAEMKFLKEHYLQWYYSFSLFFWRKSFFALTKQDLVSNVAATFFYCFWWYACQRTNYSLSRKRFRGSLLSWIACGAEVTSSKEATGNHTSHS